MRVNHIERCNKSPGDCGKCGKTIKKGEPYKWAQAYRSSKRIRCDDPKCAFRPSDLTGSDKLSRVYAAQEAAEDGLASCEDAASFVSLCDDMANELREVAEEYRDAAEAMGGAGQEMEDKADEIESWADEVEGAAGDIEDFEEAEGGNAKNAAGQTREEWLEEARQAVSDAIGNCPV